MLSILHRIPKIYTAPSSSGRHEGDHVVAWLQAVGSVNPGVKQYLYMYIYIYVVYIWTIMVYNGLYMVYIWSIYGLYHIKPIYWDNC
jgi:hypothetical protein